jgi:hypothetical protein
MGQNSKEAAATPELFLGPGASSMSPEEYKRTYSNYIKATLLMGYPLLGEALPPCGQALNELFRQMGFHGYPVPADAQGVRRSSGQANQKKIEVYESGGQLVQLVRERDDSLVSLFWINSSSPKASRRLWGFARNEILTLERNSKTGLEQVRGTPVGYPHPFLTNDGQGLWVRELRFKGKKENCLPMQFSDNAWAGGFQLDRSLCTELQGRAVKAWKEEITSEEFAQLHLQSLKSLALANARSRGVKEAEANAIIEKTFQPPFTNRINLVGSAMRSLQQCNALALGGMISAPRGEAESPSSPTVAPGGGSSGSGR